MATERLQDLVIANGQTKSNVIGRKSVDRSHSIAIQAPATLPETVTVEVTLDDSTWAILQSSGANIILTAGAVTVITSAPILGLRLSASVAVTAARTFFMNRIWERS